MKNRSVDLAVFKRIQQEMVAKTEDAWKRWYNIQDTHIRNYTLEEIEQIINSSSLSAQQELSRDYFLRNGLYKRIILYYATVLNYTGLLIPNPSFGKQLSTPHISKRYHMALNYLDKMHLEETLTRISISALVEGTYYGLVKLISKDEFVLFDLPVSYCRSRYRDLFGNDIVEFDVRYFERIIDEEMRKKALSTYPKLISSYYAQYSKGKASDPWIALPAEMGICFSFLNEEIPFFVNTIPAIVQYEDAVDTERERDKEEIRKIIVQKVPHLADGQLLFEPDEALEMHSGAVNMMKGNKNLSILTTYADVDAIISKTSAENATNSIEKMMQNVYGSAGASQLLFAPTGGQALSTSIANDIALMMVLARKYAHFITIVINNLFSNSNIDFVYKILPVGQYNYDEYITNTLKLAQNGYSFLLPAMASGLNQKEIVNIKDLENNVLKLGEIFIPLSSSYTQSNKQTAADAKDGPGAPEKKLEDKSEKTIQNEDSLDNQGGSNE